MVAYPPHAWRHLRKLDTERDCAPTEILYTPMNGYAAADFSYGHFVVLFIIGIIFRWFFWSVWTMLTRLTAIGTYIYINVIFPWISLQKLMYSRISNFLKADLAKTSQRQIRTPKRGKDWARPPVLNLPLCHWLIGQICAPSSSCLYFGRFPFVRTGRPGLCPTSQFENERGFFQEFSWKTMSFVRTIQKLTNLDGEFWLKGKFATGMVWLVSSDKWKAP